MDTARPQCDNGNKRKGQNMDTRANGIRCLVGTVFLLGAIGTTVAGPLMPLYEGEVTTSHLRDASDLIGWDVERIVMGPKVTLGSHDYWHVQGWNYDHSAHVRDVGYWRSTDQAV